MLKIIYIANGTSSQMNHALLSAHRSIFCGLTQSSSQPVYSLPVEPPQRPHLLFGLFGTVALQELLCCEMSGLFVSHACSPWKWHCSMGRHQRWIFPRSVYSRIPEMPRCAPTKLNFWPFLTRGDKGALELRVGTGSLQGLDMLPSIYPLGSSNVMSSGV